MLLTLVVGTIVFGGGVLFGAQFIKSPAQAAADATPPSAGPVTVPVERRVLRNTVVVPGHVAAARSVDIRPPAVRDAAKPVVTRLPLKAGDPVTAGSVIAEVSGRPVIVLPGAQPAYRDLVPAAQGNDVAELQDALAAVGHPAGGDARGTYGPGTKAAVTALYQAAGYSAQDTSPDDDQQVLTAQRRVRDAREALAAAQSQPMAPGQPDPGTAVAQAAQALSDARDDLARLVLHTGAEVPAGEIVFVPFLPARVGTLSATIGDDVPNILMTVVGGDLVVHGDLPPGDSTLVRPGQPVRIDSAALGAAGTGTVTGVAPAPPGSPPDQGTGGAGGRSGDQAARQSTVTGGDLDLLVTPTTPLGARFDGQDVRLTVESARTSGAVLVVPLAAVTAQDGGQAQVVRVTGGTRERVAVIAGLSGGGYVEVRPVSGGLAPGDQVAVGP